MLDIKKVLPLYLIVFLAFLGYSLMITIFTPMLLHPSEGLLAVKLSLPTKAILLGILLGLYPLGQFFGAPIVGSISKQLGRKPILVITLILTTLFYAWISIAVASRSIAFLMIGVFFAGLCESNVSIARNVIADISTKHEKIRLQSYLSLTIGLAYIAGPLFGGKVAAAFAYETPFWWVFLFSAMMTVWVLMKFKETHIITKRQPKLNYLDSFKNLKFLFTAKKLRKVFWINFFIYLAIFGFFRAYPMYLVEGFGLTVGKLSEFMAWASVPIIFTNFYFSSIEVKGWSPKHILIGALVFTTVFIFSVILFSSLKSFWLTLFLAGSAIAFTLPTCSALLTSVVSERILDQVKNTNQSMQFLIKALAGPIAGICASFVWRLPIVLFTFAAIIGLFLLLTFKQTNRKISYLPK